VVIIINFSSTYVVPRVRAGRLRDTCVWRHHFTDYEKSDSCQSNISSLARYWQAIL